MENSCQMTETYQIEILENFISFDINLKKYISPKIVVAPLTDTSANIYVLHSRSKRVLCFEISFQSWDINCTSLPAEDFHESYNSFKRIILYLYGIIRSPITINDLVIFKQDLWAVGTEHFFNVELQSKNVHTDANSGQEELMDISEDNEFQYNAFESVIRRDDLQNHNFCNFFCLNCDLCDGFLVCFEDKKLIEWQIILAIKTGPSITTKKNLKYIKLFNFPSFYPKNDENETQMNDHDKKLCKPHIIFYDTNHKIWNKLIGSQQKEISNRVCVVGHPKGKIMYSLCSWNAHKLSFKLVSQFQEIYDIKQSVMSISYTESLGLGVLIVLGIKGKISLLATEKFSNENNCIHLHNGLWVMNSLLTSSIQSQILLFDSIIYNSLQGDIWVTRFVNDSNKKKESNVKLITDATDFHEVLNISLINKEKGLFLMMTNGGNLYLMRYLEKTNKMPQKSLPYLMNEILEQSLSLKSLTSIKQLQSKFFASLSTFASLKFGGIRKFQLKCTLSEIDGPPKKLMVQIDLKDLDHLNLDVDFWLISTSLLSPFQLNSAIISKCQPIDQGQNVCLELLESSICPSYDHPYPLYLEVGLILHLPDYLRTLVCFKPLLKKLPLYVRTHTVMLSDLYLLKNKPDEQKTQKYISEAKMKNIMQNFATNNKKNPIFQLLNCNIMRNFAIFNEYTFCLLPSTIQGLLKSYEGSTPESCILKLIEEKCSQHFKASANLECKNQVVSIIATPRGEKICIIISSLSPTHVLSLKMAISELLLGIEQHSGKEASNCVCIQAKILHKCEVITKELLNLFGKDVSVPEFMEIIINTYCKLRKEVSEQLPF